MWLWAWSVLRLLLLLQWWCRRLSKELEWDSDWCSVPQLTAVVMESRLLECVRNVTVSVEKEHKQLKIASGSQMNGVKQSQGGN